MNLHRGRRALALVIVLVVVTMLSLASYTFTDMMLAEYQAADAHGQALQAIALPFASSSISLSK